METAGRVVAELVGCDARDTYAVVRGEPSVEFLRRTRRIYGVVEGSGGEKTAQALRLSPEELAVGLAHDFVELKTPPLVEDVDETTVAESTRRLSRELIAAACGEECGSATVIDPSRRDRVRVFHDLWERGYVVTFGSKFGADYLIYSDDPARSHAVALVVVKGFEAPFQRVDIVSFGRVAKMVKKQLYFASVRRLSPTQAEGQPRSDVVFVSLTHALLASRQEEEDAEEEERGG